MVNIFTELIIPCHYFNNSINLEDIKTDLFDYLYDNLEDENNKFRWDLRNALKTNANE
jgi:hypothetical protein